MNSTENSQSFKTESQMMNEYWNSEFHKKWLELANQNYHGQRDGWLDYCVDENNELKIIYVKER